MTDPVPILDPMPGTELLEHRLDLCRPDLAPLMNRYAPTHPMGMLDPPTLLLVTRVSGEEVPFREALERDGWFVKTCKGPGEGNCPIMSGEVCAKRAEVDAAVVFVDPKATPGGGNLPRFCCAADESSPGVVVVEGRFDPPSVRGGIALIGALRGPKELLGAISALMEEGSGSTEDGE